MIRRINIYGGPGCGKSTAAARIFSELKINGYEIELVDEYVKSWAYEKREINSFDQAYLFMQQLRKEFLVLKNSPGLIITDSPLVMSISYAMKYGFGKWSCLQEIATEFEEEYPSINIILNRSDCEYKQNGRYEDYDRALIMDDVIKNHIIGLGLDIQIMNYNDHKEILKWVISKLGK